MLLGMIAVDDCRGCIIGSNQFFGSLAATLAAKRTRGQAPGNEPGNYDDGSVGKKTREITQRTAKHVFGVQLVRVLSLFIFDNLPP